MSYVAIYTVGRLIHPYNHPASLEFFNVGDIVIGQAVKTRQLVDVIPFSPGRVPIPQEGIEGDGYPVLTLTIWKSIEALYRFTYSGLHRQALRDRNKWMERYPDKHLSYVVWWTGNVKDVTWGEAFRRYDYYIQNGATPFAFDFKHAFDDEGEAFIFNRNSEELRE